MIRNLQYQAPIKIWKPGGGDWYWWCSQGYCMFAVEGRTSQADAMNQALEHLALNHSEPTA